MKSFSGFSSDQILNEMLTEDLDREFMKNAVRVTSFNLSAKDFETLTHKKEIQELFRTYFFPTFDLSKCLNKMDATKMNTLVDELKSIDRTMFTKMHKYNLKGVGPGEVTMYFLLNNAHLGGGSSAGVDLVDGSTKYEIKSVDQSGDKKYVMNFKVGGTFSISDVVTGIQKLAKEKGVASGSEISITKIRTLRDKYAKEFKPLEDMFIKLTYDNYFKNHDIIFIKNSTKALGEIIAVKRVKKTDITIQAVTSGTIKPLIKL